LGKHSPALRTNPTLFGTGSAEGWISGLLLADLIKSSRSRRPRLLRMYEQGQLKLDELLTRTYTLEEINTGYADMHSDVNIRGAIEFA
jgi:Zn-dependent alcohol dehydrogenase